MMPVNRIDGGTPMRFWNDSSATSAMICTTDGRVFSTTAVISFSIRSRVESAGCWKGDHRRNRKTTFMAGSEPGDARFENLIHEGKVVNDARIGGRRLDRGGRKARVRLDPGEGPGQEARDDRGSGIGRLVGEPGAEVRRRPRAGDRFRGVADRQ